MNKFKKLFPAALLTIAGMMVAGGNVAPYVAFRSPGRDTARKVVGMSDKHMHLYDMEAFYGTFWIAPAYERSFKSDRIADCLFGTTVNDEREIRIQGSAAKTASNDANAWKAENFILPTDFSSKIKFTPRVQNFLVDLHFYMALDEWCEGMYFRLYGPIVHARYNLDAEENIVASGDGVATVSTVATGSPGFLSTAAIPRASMHTDAISFFRGETDLTITGVTVNKLSAAKFKEGKDKETCFGELRGELGYNLWLDEDYHFGLNIQAAAPTGHRPEGEFLFEAQCGNGKHWELGGGASMHYTLWRCEDGSSHFDFYSEIDITHMFKARQKRTFDLNGKPLSRYLLASKFNTGITSTDLFVGTTAATAVAATNQFAAEVAPVANFSTIDVKTKVSVQVDWVAMLNYSYCNWSMDLGYNLWYRSSEDIELRSGCEDSFPERTWGIKGDGFAFAFDGAAMGDPAVAITDTFSGAQITNHGTADTPITPAFGPTLTNANDPTTRQRLVTFPAGLPANAAHIASTSNPPVLITLEDLDLKGAETKGISHKIFGHINYTWMDCQDWLPYLGFGASAEFGNHSNEETSDDNLSCSLSKWSVMLKAGISFD